MARLVTLHDSDGEVIYPQSVWDKNMIPDNTVTSNMIDWSTMSENQSDIRKIHYSTFTAKTDSNGFVAVPSSLVRPSTGIILAAATTTQQCFTTPYNDNNRYTIKTEGWDRNSIGNVSVTYRITYILY